MNNRCSSAQKYNRKHTNSANRVNTQRLLRIWLITRIITCRNSRTAICISLQPTFLSPSLSLFTLIIHNRCVKGSSFRSLHKSRFFICFGFNVGSLLIPRINIVNIARFAAKAFYRLRAWLQHQAIWSVENYTVHGAVQYI